MPELKTIEDIDKLHRHELHKESVKTSGLKDYMIHVSDKITILKRNSYEGYVKTGD